MSGPDHPKKTVGAHLEGLPHEPLTPREVATWFPKGGSSKWPPVSAKSPIVCRLKATLEVIRELEQKREKRSHNTCPAMEHEKPISGAASTLLDELPKLIDGRKEVLESDRRRAAERPERIREFERRHGKNDPGDLFNDADPRLHAVEPEEWLAERDERVRALERLHDALRGAEESFFWPARKSGRAPFDARRPEDPRKGRAKRTNGVMAGAAVRLPAREPVSSNRLAPERV